jgi:hypothetical protein
MRTESRLRLLERAYAMRRCRALDGVTVLDGHRLIHRVERDGWETLAPEEQEWLMAVNALFFNDIR